MKLYEIDILDVLAGEAQSTIGIYNSFQWVHVACITFGCLPLIRGQEILGPVLLTKTLGTSVSLVQLWEQRSTLLTVDTILDIKWIWISDCMHLIKMPDLISTTVQDNMNLLRLVAENRQSTKNHDGSSCLAYYYLLFRKKCK